jgi:RNA polymerase sigma-70 factor (ECF subfamily)
MPIRSPEAAGGFPRHPPLGAAVTAGHHVVVAAPDPLEALVAAALEGDEVAVGELVRATQPAVWQVCVALGSPGDVEDLVQDTYVRALGGLSHYRGDAPVRVWLLAIARRVCADEVRRQQRRRRLIERVGRTPTRGGVPGPEVVHDLLDVLDPHRREAFVLTQLVGLSYDEAAAVVRCPIGTIRSRVARARADLLVALTRAAG